MFPQFQIENVENGVPAPTVALKWLPCGEWFGLVGEDSLICPFLKVFCNTAITTCLDPRGLLIEIQPDTSVVRLIPDPVTFKSSSLL